MPYRFKLAAGMQDEPVEDPLLSQLLSVYRPISCQIKHILTLSSTFYKNIQGNHAFLIMQF